MAGGRVLGSGGNILAIAPGGNQPVSTQQIKWPNGHWLMTENYESGTNTGSGGPGQMASEVALLKASPDMVGYIPCMVASTVEDYTQSSNIALTAGGLTGAALQTKINQQYSGLATWESWFYYQQSQVPGSLSGLIINFVISNGPTGVTGSTNFSTHPAVVPNDVRDCAGSITVPNSYGSTSTTTYQVAPIYTGSPYYGFGFANSNGGTTYAFTVPAYWNPGVNQRQRTQLWQAFYQRTFTYGPAYVATTAYTPGQVVTWTDGNSYLCIANTTGNAPPNATYWLFNRWAGKTPDAVPEFARAKTNDEVTWNCAQNASTGTVVSPPNQGSTSYPATNAAFWAAHGNNAIAVRAAGPTTRYEDCISFGFTGSDGAQSVSGMQYVVNHLFPGNAALGLSRIRGWVLSDADVMANNFNLGAPGNGWFDPYGIWSYTGALGMSSGDQWSTSGFTYYSTQFPKVSPYALSGLIGWDGEVQTGDYAIVPHGSSGITANTQSIIIPIIDNCRFAGCDTMTWSPTDNTFSGSVWASYIYPGIVASLSAHPLSTVMPAYYFYGPPIVSITGATSTTLTINWSAITGQGTGLSILLYRNGTQIASGAASSFITYTDTGLTPSTQYTYTLAMQNANGTGPQGAGFQGTTAAPSWQTLPIGGGGYVRNLIVAADGTMVGRTDSAGAYLWNAGTSSWSQLINANSMPASWVNTYFNAGMNGCYEVAIAPSNTQIFYMNYANTMWKSSNQGSTWTQLTGFGTVVCNPNSNYAQFGQRIAVDPNNTNIVYSGTDTNGVYVSSNGGTTWAAVSAIPAGTGAGITGIVFGPASNQVGGVTQVIYICSNGNGVYLSTNGGSTWALTSGGPTTVQNAQLDSAGNYWCAGNSANVWKYTASGATWANLAGGDNGMQTVAVNPFNNSEIVGIDTYGRLTFSGNGGSTWSGISNSNNYTTLSSPDIPWLAAGNVNGIDISMDTGNAAFSPLTNGLLYVSGGTGVWSMTVPTTVTPTTPLTWNDTSIGIENMVPNEIIVPPGSGPVIAQWDRSVMWITPGTYPSFYLPSISSTNTGILAAWSIDYASSDSTFVCGIVDFGGTQLSGYNHGTPSSGGTHGSWVVFPSIPVGAAQNGCIAASTPSNIVFGSAGNAPSYTTDGGNTWTQISIAGMTWSGFVLYGGYRKICADRVTANTFYLYTSTASTVGVYISTNSGATWTQQHAGYIEANSSYANILNPQMKSVPGNAGHLFYCSGPNQYSGSTQTSPLTDAYFYRSTNSGVTWTQVANVLEVSSFGFGMAKPGGGGYPAVFINGFVNGVFGFWRSDDNCVTWTNIGTFAGPNGLSTVVSMSGDMNNYGYCYVGLGGAGSIGRGAGASYAYYVP
jgi:hypothetical protein